MKKVVRRKSDRRNLPVSDETHKHLQILAALDRTSIQAAFDKYAAPAVAKAFEQKTAPTK